MHYGLLFQNNWIFMVFQIFKRNGFLDFLIFCDFWPYLGTEKSYQISYFIFVADAADIVLGENFVSQGEILDLEISWMWRYFRCGEVLYVEKFWI